MKIRIAFGLPERVGPGAGRREQDVALLARQTVLEVSVVDLAADLDPGAAAQPRRSRDSDVP